MSERDLLRSAQLGDTRAFEALAEPCEKMVWGVCWKMMQNRQDAEDAAQTTMLKAWEKIGTFTGNAAFSTWLYRIAVTTCMDALRRRNVRDAASVDALSESGFDIPSPDPLPPEQLEQKERKERLLSALALLADEQRLPLLRFYMDGKSYEEIAEESCLPLGTVKSRISRGRIQLKKILNDMETEGTNNGSVRHIFTKGGHGNDLE